MDFLEILMVPQINSHKTQKKAYFYAAIRRVNNNFGGIPTKRTSCGYLEEQKCILPFSFNSEFLKSCRTLSKVRNHSSLCF